MTEDKDKKEKEKLGVPGAQRIWRREIDREQMIVKIPESLIREADRIADQKNTSRNQIITQLIRELSDKKYRFFKDRHEPPEINL